MKPQKLNIQCYLQLLKDENLKYQSNKMCTVLVCWEWYNAKKMNQRPKQRGRCTVFMDWKTQCSKGYNSSLIDI